MVLALSIEEPCVENVVALQKIAIASLIDAGVVDGSRRGEELRVELDDETVQGVLKSGERVGVGEGGLKMGQHLGHGSVSDCSGGQRWRMPAQEKRADVALAEEESSPESLPGSGTEPAANNACGRGDAVGNDALQEPPQQSSGHAHASDFVDAPDADGVTATGTGVAVIAEDSPGPDGFFAGRSRHRSHADSHAERACRPPDSADTASI